MRIARLCKELHITPRGGGILDQPAHEISLLEKVFEASDEHQKRVEEKEKTRKRNRDRHKVEG